MTKEVFIWLIIPKGYSTTKDFFYIALAVCMLALGSASASALKSYRDVQKEETSLAASVPDSAPDAKRPTNR